jgi:heme-degrading monooxygenase HmoA
MIRVIIERRVMEGKVAEYQHAVRGVRLEAMACEGYISGETLRDVKDPSRYVVLSTWNNLDAWKAWASSEARRRLMAKIKPMLTESEQIQVLEPA